MRMKKALLVGASLFMLAAGSVVLSLGAMAATAADQVDTAAVQPDPLPNGMIILKEDGGRSFTNSTLTVTPDGKWSYVVMQGAQLLEHKKGNLSKSQTEQLHTWRTSSALAAEAALPTHRAE